MLTTVAFSLSNLEMLFINLIICYLCSRRKYSSLKTILLLVIYTTLCILFIGPMMTMLRTLKGPNLLSIGIGFIFLPLLKLLFDESWYRQLIIMCFTWTYTLIIRLTVFILFDLYHDTSTYSTLSFIVQTLLYIISLPLLIRFTKNRFAYIMQNISPKNLNQFGMTCILWFCFCVLLFASFTTPHTLYLILTLFVLLIGIIMNHNMLYTLTQSFKTTSYLEEVAYTDFLTSANNRSCFFEKVPSYLSKNIPFTLLYLDLDNFKSINDHYGHYIGDAYLTLFVKKATELLSDQGEIYRIAGDEFIIIFHKEPSKTLLDALSSIHWSAATLTAPFLGISYGIASYPAHGTTLEDLMMIADNALYSQKNHKKQQQYM